MALNGYNCAWNVDFNLKGRKMAKIDELKAVQVKLMEVFKLLYAVEDEMPEASTDHEMELDEGYEMIQQAVMDVGNLIATIEAILKRNENDQDE